MNVLCTAVLVAALHAGPDAPRLSVIVAPGFLGGEPGPGLSLELGARFRAGSLAVEFDAGYGAMGLTQVQDRWWLMPSLAGTFSVGPLQLDLGGGLGLGASSGYAGWREFFAGPFDPNWAFQLVPAARVHATATTEVDGRGRLFLRLEAATLLLTGKTIGMREGNPGFTFGDTSWLNFAVGGEVGLF